MRRMPATIRCTRVVQGGRTARSPEFLTRDVALVVLAFVVLYKFCDAFAGTMTAPFVIDLGFTRNDYAGDRQGRRPRRDADRRLRRRRRWRARCRWSTCLWIGAILQTVSNLVFTWLALVGTNYWALTAAIIAENFTGAIGTVIFVAYLSALCKSPLHTATQFALLTRALRGRPHLPVGRRGLRRAKRPAGRCSSSSARWSRSRASSLLAWLQARGHFDTIGKPTVVSGGRLNLLDDPGAPPMPVGIMFTSTQ